MQLQRRYMRRNDSKNRVLFSKNLFSANDIVFYSNGFQVELIDSTQHDNQTVLPGDSLLPDMVIYYCDCFCVLGAGAEDLPSILSIFPKQNFLILS